MGTREYSILCNLHFGAADPYIAEDQLPYGYGVCKVWETLTTWFGGATPPRSALSLLHIVHKGPDRILPNEHDLSNL